MVKHNVLPSCQAWTGMSRIPSARQVVEGRPFWPVGESPSMWAVGLKVIPAPLWLEGWQGECVPCLRCVSL